MVSFEITCSAEFAKAQEMEIITINLEVIELSKNN